MSISNLLIVAYCSEDGLIPNGSLGQRSAIFYNMPIHDYDYFSLMWIIFRLHIYQFS